MSERGAISPERDEIVGERGAEMSGAVWCDFERWSGGSEHPRERGAEILTAQLRSHALVCTGLTCKFEMEKKFNKKYYIQCVRKVFRPP